MQTAKRNAGRMRIRLAGTISGADRHRACGVATRAIQFVPSDESQWNADRVSMKNPFPPAIFTRLLPCLLGLLLCAAPPSRADETIRQVQEELRKRNLFYGDIDGRATPEVAAALRRYQERKGFEPSGEPDDTTLRSLNLLPALPLTAEERAATGSQPHGATPVLQWPDIVVLRSDAARRNPAPPATTPADDAPAVDASPALTRASATPLPAPPSPASVAARKRPTPEEVRAYIASYLQAGQSNDAPAELAFYADHVDYFNEGVVDRRFIENDVARYDRRWPQRRFTLLDPLTVSELRETRVT